METVGKQKSKIHSNNTLAASLYSIYSFVKMIDVSSQRLYRGVYTSGVQKSAVTPTHFSSELT